MNLGQLGILVWSGRWRILLCALACFAGALTISLRLPKSYEAKARVLLELVRADPVTGISIGNKQTEAYVQTQQLLATSGRVGERVIEKLGWASNPAVVEAWQQQTGGNGDIRTWAASRLLGEVGAYPLEGGGTLEIVYRAPDPEAAEAIVRAIRESYIETALALQTEAAARRAERFAELLKPAQATLAKAQDELVRAQRETGTVLTPLGADVEAGKLNDLESSAITTRLQAEHDAAESALRTSSISADSLRRTLGQVEQQIALAERTMGPDNPDYQALIGRRNELIRQISREMAAIRNAASITGSAARQLAAAPEQAYQIERERVLGRAPQNLRISQALRLVALRQGEVTRLQNNLANAVQASERSESGLVVMGDVITNPHPVAPNIPLNSGLAVVFGIGLGLASVLIDGLARREVLGATDLAGASGVPVLAVVSGSRKRRGWLRRLWPRRRGPIAA